MIKRELKLALFFFFLSVSIALPAIIVPIHFRFTFHFNDEDGNITSVILIEHNDDFVRYGFKGSGTLGDPYTLTNKKINTIKKCAIAIIGTSAYFHITNCTISTKYIGIYIKSVGAGTCEISNNHISLKNILRYVNNYACIYVLDSESSKIINNYCTSLHSNYFYKKGISVNYSDNTIIQNNTCLNFLRSITILYSNGVSLINNTIFDNHSRLYIVFCESILVMNNSFSLNGNGGLSFWNCKTIVISYNSFNNCDQFGISSRECENITITYNHFNQSQSILFYSTINSVVHHNNFYKIEIPYQTIDSQAYDNSQTNIWYDHLTQEGNFWSDLSWDDGVIYRIGGPANNTDLYPLEEPVNI